MVLLFSGHAGAVVHVRAYEAGEDVDPVVILGAFGDRVGCSITNAVEHVMAAVQSQLYPDGCLLRFVEHYPTPIMQRRSYPPFQPPCATAGATTAPLGCDGGGAGAKRAPRSRQ